MKSKLYLITFSTFDVEWMLGEFFLLAIVIYLLFFVYIRLLKRKTSFRRSSCILKSSGNEVSDADERTNFKNFLLDRIESSRSVIHFKKSCVRSLSNRLTTLRIYENSLYIHDRDLFTALMDKCFGELSDKLSFFRVNHDEFIYCSMVLMKIDEGELRHILQLTRLDLIRFEENLSLKFRLQSRSALKDFIRNFHPDYSNI